MNVVNIVNHIFNLINVFMPTSYTSWYTYQRFTLIILVTMYLVYCNAKLGNLGIYHNIYYFWCQHLFFPMNTVPYSLIRTPNDVLPLLTSLNYFVLKCSISLQTTFKWNKNSPLANVSNGYTTHKHIFFDITTKNDYRT